MKRALHFSLAAILALPLVAEEPKSEPKKSDTTAAQAQPATADSPLVKASKRSGRRGKSRSIVITNDTLKASKGHITTSHTAQAPLRVPEPKPGPEAELARQKAERAEAERKLAAQQAEAAKKAAEHRTQLRANATTQAEHGMYESLDGDPAAAERAAEQTDPNAQGESKPPVE